MADKIKNAIGLDKKSAYQVNFFERANVRAGVYMSCVMIVLELWMIARVLKSVFFGGKERTIEWIVQHLASYVVLLVMAILLLVYCAEYIKGMMSTGKTWGRIVMITFSTVCVIFGMYISYLDYAKGEQILTFLTMILFVVALLNWRPIVSIAVLTISFGIFYLLMNNVVAASEATNINLFIYWISLLMVSISIYHQRRSEAVKSEQIEKVNDRLERLAVRDVVTDIYNMNYFYEKAPDMLKDDRIPLDDMLFLFMNIRNFKIYNGKYSFSKGDELLSAIAKRIESVFDGDLTARMSDDHFVVLTLNADLAMSRLEEIRDYLHEKSEEEVFLELKVGGYIPESRDVDISDAWDRARYACREIHDVYDENYRLYDKETIKGLEIRHYVDTHVKKAVESGYIRPYYQPVVWSEDGTVCGMEALARWIDPVRGFLSPGDFIPALEASRQIHIIDMAIVEMVCADIKERMDGAKSVLPVSVNFSRLDFELFDVETFLKDMVEKYSISPEYIHVEVTESALTEHVDELKEALRALSAAGFPLWLDDFGAGYSSLNVLKDYEFDVMKIDMKFLTNFTSNEKTRPILDSVVQMAERINMRTLTEGVETMEESKFLKDIGCERLQGFLYGKPMPKEDFYDKLASGELTISDRLLR